MTGILSSLSSARAWLLGHAATAIFGLCALTTLTVAAFLPALAIAAAVVLLTAGCYVFDKRIALLVFFIWALSQNSLISMLNAWGLSDDATVWLRRSDEVLLVVLGLATVFDQVITHGRVTLYGVGTPVVALFMVAAVSAVRAGRAPLFVSALDLFLLLKGATLFVIVAHIGRDPRPTKMRGVLLFIIGIGVLALAVASLEIIDVSGFREVVGLPTLSYVRAGWDSLQGPFVHPGVFGWYMAICAIACATLAMHGDRRCWFWMLPFVLGVLASGRRKPLGGVVVAVLLLVWLSSQRAVRWRHLLWGVLGTAAVLLLFWPFVSDLVLAAVRDYVLTRNPLAQARNALYFGSAVLAWRYFPLGAGPGLFGGYAARLYYSPLYTQMGLNHVWGLSQANPMFLDDTFWPHVLGEFGVLGVVAYCWLLWVMVRRALSASEGANGSSRVMARFGIAVLSEGIVESIAGPGFEQSLTAMVIFGGMALATGAAWEGLGASTDRQAPIRASSS